MSEKYKLFATEHPGSVPQHIVERRLAKAESGKSRKIRKLGAVVVAGVAAVSTVKALDRAIDHEERIHQPPKQQSFDYVGHGVQPSFVSQTPESDQK